MINSFIQIIILLSIGLIFIPSIIYATLHIVFYHRSKKYYKHPRIDNLKDISLTIVIPVRNEPLEYIAKRLEEISIWGNKSKVDVVIVSMDPYDYYLSIRKIANKYVNQGLNTYVIWRNTIEGYKARSLNIALWFSNKKYFYIMDVDSVVEPGFIETACGLMEGDQNTVAVVGKWIGLNRDSRIAQAIASSIDFLTETIYKGRYVSKLPVYPLGTGTVYRKDYLIKLNGWDENRLLDDLEIGCRIVFRGGRIIYLDNYNISVEVPRKYSSLSTQQERWVYGTVDVLLTRFRHIWGSPQSLLGKIDMTMYLLQYLPSITTLLGALFLALLYLFIKTDILVNYWCIGVLWTILISIYSKCYISALTRRNYSVKESLVNIGRSSVLLVILSPVFLKSFFMRIMGFGIEFKRTPKGAYDELVTKYRFPYEFLIGFTLLIYSLYLLVNSIVYTSLWFMIYSFPYIYASIKWRREIMYV